MAIIQKIAIMIIGVLKAEYLILFSEVISFTSAHCSILFHTYALPGFFLFLKHTPRFQIGFYITAGEPDGAILFCGKEDELIIVVKGALLG